MDYAEFRETDLSTPQTTTAQIRSRRLHPTSKASVGAGRLALSRVRFHEALTSTSHETQEPARRRCDAQLDYALRYLPPKGTSWSPLDTLYRRSGLLSLTLALLWMYKVG
jgi:hypothetical protein